MTRLADHPGHDQAQDLLPWLANGTLTEAERAQVQAHVNECAQCRADLADLRTLRAAGPGPALELDPEAALARLMPRLDIPTAPDAAPAPQPPLSPMLATPPLVPGWRERLAANERSWLRWGTALQFGAIAVLATLLAQRAADDPAQAGASAGPYRVLGAGQAARAALIVTFRPDTPESELRRIVRAHGARIVGGPTATDAWLLDADGAPSAVLQGLRQEPAVTLAEPLATESRP